MNQLRLTSKFHFVAFITIQVECSIPYSRAFVIKASHWVYTMKALLSEVFIMLSGPYRIESRETIKGSLLPPSNFSHLYKDYSLAVAVAVKSVADPMCQDIRVVHVPSGEIVFHTPGACKAS